MMEKDESRERDRIKPGWQQRLAAGLQKAYGRLSPGATVLLWLALVTGMGGYCGLLVWEGIRGKGASVLRLTPIRQLPVDGMGPVALPRISTAEYQQLTTALARLDSLKQACPDCYLKFTTKHPGLQDSLRMAVQVYQQQNSSTLNSK